MDQKYLDGDGVKYLWGKVEGRSFPVRFMTQYEYNMLPKKEKEANILYIVDGTSADEEDGKDPFLPVGIPSGGTPGQVLKKKTEEDYDTEWGNEQKINLLTEDEVDEILTGEKIGASNKLLDGDGLENVWQGVVKRSVPVKVVSKDEYDALGDEQKKDVLYVVNEPPWSATDLRIQEYDTTLDECDWHVRKWSNGYCELIGAKKYTEIGIDSAWENLYTSAEIGKIKLPVYLTKKYGELSSFTENSLSAILATGINKGDSTVSETIAAIRPNPASNASLTLNIYITGRWK